MTVKVGLKIKRLSPPELRDELLIKAGNLIAEDMARRAARKRPIAADGSAIKRNAKTTIQAKKRRLAKGIITHIAPLYWEKGRFRERSGYQVFVKKLNPFRGGVTVRPRAATIAGYVIDLGYDWIGISPQARARISKMLNREVARLSRAAVRKSRIITKRF